MRDDRTDYLLSIAYHQAGTNVISCNTERGCSQSQAVIRGSIEQKVRQGHDVGGQIQYLGHSRCLIHIQMRSSGQDQKIKAPVPWSVKPSYIPITQSCRYTDEQYRLIRQLFLFGLCTHVLIPQHIKCHDWKHYHHHMLDHGITHHKRKTGSNVGNPQWLPGRRTAPSRSVACL